MMIKLTVISLMRKLIMFQLHLDDSNINLLIAKIFYHSQIFNIRFLFLFFTTQTADGGLII